MGSAGRRAGLGFVLGGVLAGCSVGDALVGTPDLSDDGGQVAVAEPAVNPIDAEFAARFAVYDYNGDGVVSSGEYFRQRRLAFNAADTDRDGRAVQVCPRAVTAAEQEVSFDDCTAAWTIEYANLAGTDGLVSFDEFVAVGGFS